MNKKWFILGAVVLGLLWIGSCVGSQYNKLVTMNESITGSWAQVENVLQRRNDLIPNLVNTVKGYAAHEDKIFTEVAEARAKLAGATTINEKVQANSELGAVVGRLLMIAENYPDLKANQNFLALQDELAGTENRIAVERRRYNEVVQTYNILVKRFPSNVVASLAGFEKKDAYFEATEGAEAVPEVKF